MQKDEKSVLNPFNCLVVGKLITHSIYNFKRLSAKRKYIEWQITQIGGSVKQIMPYKYESDILLSF